MTNWNDFTNYNIRRWTANEASNVDTKWYLDRYGDVAGGWGGGQNVHDMHWADYVRAHSDLNAAWVNERTAGVGPGSQMSRWDYGKYHWDNWGKNEGGRIRPIVVGGMKNDWTQTDVIHWDPGNPNKSKHAFAAWHYAKGGGKQEGRFGSHLDWYNSPGEQDRRAAEERARIEAWEKEMAAEAAARAQEAAEGAEAGRLAAQRGGGSYTQGASGAATFKGKGLKSSENRRGKGRGTGQLRRPYGTSSLAIASSGATGGGVINK